jgi:hypothetical protein
MPTIRPFLPSRSLALTVGIILAIAAHCVVPVLFEGLPRNGSFTHPDNGVA